MKTNKTRRPAADIELARGPFGTYLIKHLPTGLDILTQTSWDYPGLASSFGMGRRPRRLPDIGGRRTYCQHDSTDGTVTCETCGKTATEFIEEATAWLDDHIGARAEDPGYFSPEYIEQARRSEDNKP